MSDYEQAVFISYAWGEESHEREAIVNQLDQSLQKRGLKIIRDKRDLGYKGSIRKFMERIGDGNCVIVIISDKYLRSPSCMFELVEITEGKQFHDRIFPIVLGDANIYDPMKRIEYVKYWEVKRAELADAMRTLDPANLQGIRDDMDLYDRIRDQISSLVSTLKDMNTFTVDKHQANDFQQLYNELVKRMPVVASVTSNKSTPNVSTPESRSMAIENGSEKENKREPNIGFQFNAPVTGQHQTFVNGDVSNINQGLSMDDLKQLNNLFQPFREQVQQAARPDQQNQSEEKLQELHGELSKGESVNADRLTQIVDGLVEMVPGAVSAVVSMFANPILSTLLGPATKLVLDHIKKQANK